MKSLRELEGRRILIVEDEYFIAEDIATTVSGAGGAVIGPHGTVDAALEVVRTDPDLAGAVLDINLHGKMAFPVADALHERNVAFVFATGYDVKVIPDRFAQVPRCEKPVDPVAIVERLGRAIAARDAQSR